MDSFLDASGKIDLAAVEAVIYEPDEKFLPWGRMALRLALTELETNRRHYEQALARQHKRVVELEALVRAIEPK